MEDTLITLLFAGTEKTVEDFIASKLGLAFRKLVISQAADIDSILENPIEPPPPAILCGPGITSPSPSELAQFMRMQFGDSALFYITDRIKKIDRAEFLKQGYQDILSIEMDKLLIIDVLKGALAARNAQIKAYRSVKLVDIEEGMVLDFDTMVHLPLNNKYLSFTAAGNALSVEKMGRLKKYGYANIHIPHSQVKQFFQYTSNRFKDLEANQQITATEKQDRVRNMVRSLMGDMIVETEDGESIQSGKKLTSDCQKIVTQYMLTTESGSWYKKLLTSPDESGDMYAHLTNVATFATLFSLATRIGKPETLAFAGMIHDLGMTRIPENIRNQEYETLSPKDKELYETHVQITLDMIRERKMIVTDEIKTLVSQHHEAINGSGYPKHISGLVFRNESRLLAIADYFDELITPKAGQKKRSIPEALGILKAHSYRKKEDQIYDPEILTKVISLFQPEADSS